MILTRKAVMGHDGIPVQLRAGFGIFWSVAAYMPGRVGKPYASCRAGPHEMMNLHETPPIRSYTGTRAL